MFSEFDREFLILQFKEKASQSQHEALRNAYNKIIDLGERYNLTPERNYIRRILLKNKIQRHINAADNFLSSIAVSDIHGQSF